MSRNGDMGAHKGPLGVVCGSHVVGSTPSGFDTGRGIRETLSHRARSPAASIFSTSNHAFV